MSALQKAIKERADAYSAAIELAIERVENDPEAWAIIAQLKEAVELVRCLRRLLEGRSVAEIHRAFGAPGDFGYDSMIGAALAETYGLRTHGSAQ